MKDIKEELAELESELSEAEMGLHCWKLKIDSIKREMSLLEKDLTNKGETK